MMTIGQLAKQAGVNVQTVRFYERQGLIAPPQRTASGYRQYTSDTLRRLHFIRHAQDIGFTLREIDELLALRLDADTSCSDIQERAFAKIEEIEHRIARMEQMKQALLALAEQCGAEKAVSDCPILDALDAQTNGQVP